jgi:SlyX protein
MPELPSRLDALETRDAYREDTLAQLSEQIYRQHKQLERLEHLVQTLEQKVKGLVSGEGAPLPDNERPPHY